LLLKGAKVITDQDILTPEEIRRAGLYAESLIPNGLEWFAVVGFWSGPALWGCSILRSDREGAFDGDDKRVLAGLSERLSEAATLSRAVGQAVLAGMTNALGLVSQPALALDRSGFVLDINTAAEHVLDDDVRVSNRRLLLCDKRAKSELDELIDRLRNTPDTVALTCAPIVVERPNRRPLVLRVLAVDGAARTPFLGARALLLLTDLEVRRPPPAAVMGQAFGLSPAETRRASLIASGLPPERAAEELGIAVETARTQLKSVFAKTDTHRQSELVALLARLS
jgi:DNA-binding CsgD family transcriptional regulator